MAEINVYLYGSLAATGKGHKTQAVIESVIKGSMKIECEIKNKDGYRLK